MEKQVYELKIDPELRDLIPPLSEEEHRMLEDSIVRDGCDTPLIVWNDTIVDGHNRYDICRKHGVPFFYEVRSFADKEAAMFWMLEHQLARRNLEPYQRAEIMLKYAPILRRDAAKRQATSTGGAEPQLRPNLAEADHKPFTRDQLAKMAGVSHGTLDKVKMLDARADEETKKKLRIGEVSIHKAYTDLMNSEHEGETRICECCGQEKPYSGFRIPSKSIDYRPICKDCEAKAKQAARDAEAAAIQQNSQEAIKPDPSAPVPSSVSGMAIKDGKLAHVKVGLPDTPEEFTHVVQMLKSAQDYYITAFRSIIEQYSPSMISPEHNELLQGMIDSTADAVDDLFNDHIKEDK